MKRLRDAWFVLIGRIDVNDITYLRNSGRYYWQQVCHLRRAFRDGRELTIDDFYPTRR